MYLIDPTNNKYFQGLARYIKENFLPERAEITTDYTKKGTWVLDFVSFKNGIHKIVKHDYIAIQTEQMNAKGTTEYLEFLNNAIAVRDWRTNFRIGYSDEWRLEMEQAKDIDVLFFGEMNERRENVIHSINDNGIEVNVLTGIYGSELQSFVMRSKIVLSIHYYEHPENDMPRIAPLLSNRAFVIAEECTEKWFNDIDDIVIVNHKEIAETVVFYLSRPHLRLMFIDKGYDFIKNFK